MFVSNQTLTPPLDKTHSERWLRIFINSPNLTDKTQKKTHTPTTQTQHFTPIKKKKICSTIHELVPWKQRIQVFIWTQWWEEGGETGEGEVTSVSSTRWGNFV